MMNRIIYSFFAGVALIVASCSPAKKATPPLAGARMGGPFTLTNQDGQRISDRDFAGRYRLVYFGYTFCPDVCPVDVQRLMKGFAAFEKQSPGKAAKVQPIFISVDPKRDTPTALKQFVSAFHPRLIGLTGSEAEIDDAAKAYGVYFERGTPNADGAYLVNHSNNAILYGPKGEPIAIIAHDGGAEGIADELGRWVE